MSSSINKVQELCVARGLSNPTYTFSSGGEPHLPSWKATICLHDNKTFSGCGNKKGAAKEDAASKAIDHLTQSLNVSNNTSKIINDDDFESCTNLIFVDLDNFPQIIKAHDICEKYNIIAFAAKNNPHILSKDVSFKINVIESTRRDAADHYLTWTLSVIISKYQHHFVKNNCSIYILSKDNFAGALVDIIKQETELDAKQIVNLKELET